MKRILKTSSKRVLLNSISAILLSTILSWKISKKKKKKKSMIKELILIKIIKNSMAITSKIPMTCHSLSHLLLIDMLFIPMICFLTPTLTFNNFKNNALAFVQLSQQYCNLIPGLKVHVLWINNILLCCLFWEQIVCIRDAIGLSC